MKRLVYSPEVHAWIKTDSGVFDLSPYITAVTVNRKVNQVSSAELTFRNPKVDLGDGQPKFLFTQHKNGDNYGPMFHPMDPIIISLTRIKGYPVQVFTGYCDTVPYFQMYPGVAKLTASCTLKRLQYTYWDPGLPFVIEYLASKGWALQDGSAINVSAEANINNNLLNDSSIGYLLFEVLKDVGGWDANDIFIQALPNKQITAIVEGLYEDLTGEAKASFETMKDFLKKTISVDSNLGGGGGPGSTTPTGSTTNEEMNAPEQVKDGEIFEATVYGPPWNALEGGPITSTGKPLPGPTNKSQMDGPYYFAADPGLIPYGSKWYIWPNPFNYRGTFSCEDTGGAFLGKGEKHIDIFDPRGRQWQNSFGGVRGLQNNSDGPYGGKYVKIKRAT